jgi:hypothetical protein
MEFPEKVCNIFAVFFSNLDKSEFLRFDLFNLKKT